MKRTLIVLSCAAFVAGCGSVQSSAEFSAPNALIHGEIQQRIEQLPFQHREELMNNLLWLANQGEPAMGQLILALKNKEPKVRSSVVWTLGRMGDRRAVPHLQSLVTRETDETVRLETARTLLLLGDFTQTLALINGLESERLHVRYLCHEALRSQSGHDFGYDHRVEDASERSKAVQQWRLWWSEQSADPSRTSKSGSATIDFSGNPPAHEAAAAPKDPWSSVRSNDGGDAELGAAPGGAAVLQGPGTRPGTRRDSRPQSRPQSRPTSRGTNR